MIGFGLRLTLRGGREAAARLAVTAAAVALGVGLLLVTLAAVNGVGSQNARYAWLNSGTPGATAADAVPSPDPLWGTLGTDRYEGRRIIRVDVAATGPESPVPPGLPRLPEPGQYYASPALSELLRTTPPAELGDRYPGREVGTIGPSALPAPNSLIIVVGREVDELSQLPRVAQVTSIATVNPGSCPECRVGTNSNGIALLLSVTAAALLFPVLMFIATATRLSAARREQRFAAMRLVGATPRQVAVVSAVESTVAAVAGTVVGFGLFLILRGPLAEVAFTSEPFFPSDLALSGVQVIAVAVGVPLAAALVARLALRRVRISPLGVSRRVTPRPPRAYRLIPLLVGLGELAYFVDRRPGTTGGQIWAYMSGLLLVMVGLVVAGPWLTMVGARVLARRTDRPATLVAGRRLSDDPKAGFRAVSGLVLALFVTTTAVGVMTTMIAERGSSGGDAAQQDTLMIDFPPRPLGSAAPSEPVATVPESVLAGLRSFAGVEGVVVLRTNPLGTTVPVGPWQMDADLVSCGQLADLSGFGRCAAGADAASVPPSFIAFDSDSSWSTTTWPTAAISSAQLEDLPVQGIVVGTDGSRIEETRTALAAALPSSEPPVTVAEAGPDSAIARDLAGFQQLANVVIVMSLCIAGCSLAVNVVAGLNDRKRPFSLLRLTGFPLSALRRTVVLETAVPLLVVAVVAIGAGFLAAQLFLASQLGYTLSPPGASYVMTVIAGLAASLLVIASTLPLLGRITGPETARNE